MMHAARRDEPVELGTREWGRLRLATTDLDVLGETFGLSREEALARLRQQTREDVASAWRAADPSTPEEIHRFYADTDQYVWELTCWNSCEAWGVYRRRLDTLAARWPADRFPRVLDYGCGIGTAALHLASLGYTVTLADVPGKTLGFARTRLRAHGFDPPVLELPKRPLELPPESFDLLVCFDVLEHVPEPDVVTRSLVRALTRGGGAAIVASFGRDAEYPQHLPVGAARFGDERFGMFLKSLGLRRVGFDVYERLGRPGTALRRALYGLWRATGIYVERRPR